MFRKLWFRLLLKLVGGIPVKTFEIDETVTTEGGGESHILKSYRLIVQATKDGKSVSILSPYDGCAFFFVPEMNSFYKVEMPKHYWSLDKVELDLIGEPPIKIGKAPYFNGIGFHGTN